MHPQHRSDSRARVRSSLLTLLLLLTSASSASPPPPTTAPGWRRPPKQAVVKGEYPRAVALFRGLVGAAAEGSVAGLPARRGLHARRSVRRGDRRVPSLRRAAARRIRRASARAEAEANRLEEAPAPFAETLFKQASATAGGQAALRRRQEGRAGQAVRRRRSTSCRRRCCSIPICPDPIACSARSTARPAIAAQERLFLADYLRVRPDGKIADTVRADARPRSTCSARSSIDASFPCKVYINGRETGQATPLKQATRCRPASTSSVWRTSSITSCATCASTSSPARTSKRRSRSASSSTKLDPWARVRVDGKDIGLWDEAGIPEGTHTRRVQEPRRHQREDPWSSTIKGGARAEAELVDSSRSCPWPADHIGPSSSKLQPGSPHDPTPFGKYLLLGLIARGGMAEVYRAKRATAAPARRAAARHQVHAAAAGQGGALRRDVHPRGQARGAARQRLHRANLRDRPHRGALLHRDGVHRRQGSDADAPSLPGVEPAHPGAARLLHRGADVPRGCTTRTRAPTPRGGRSTSSTATSRRRTCASATTATSSCSTSASRRRCSSSPARSACSRASSATCRPSRSAACRVDARTDVFSTGIILHEMLTTEKLFRGDTEFALMEKVRKAEVPPPSKFNRRVPEALDAIVLKALARDLPDRYQSAERARRRSRRVHARSTASSPSEMQEFVRGLFRADYGKEADEIEACRAPPSTPSRRRSRSSRRAILIDSTQPIETPMPMPIRRRCPWRRRRCRRRWRRSRSPRPARPARRRCKASGLWSRLRDKFTK